MTVPEWVKPTAWGAVGGAVVLAIVAFSAGWVVTGGSAQEMAENKAEKAVLSALTPICVAQFKSTAKATTVTDGDQAAQVQSQGAMLAALEETDSWQRGDFVEKKGWATMPGSTEPNEEVAQACADELMKLTKKQQEQ